MNLCQKVGRRLVLQIWLHSRFPCRPNHATSPYFPTPTHTQKNQNKKKNKTKKKKEEKGKTGKKKLKKQ
jgi:hypothetical protein